MKKAISILCVIAILCTLLAACGGNKDLSQSKYLGTWKATTIGVKDSVDPFEDVFIVTLNADGTATVIADDATTNCTWTETSKGFKLQGDSKISFKDDGDGVAYSLLGAKIHLDRQ